MVEWQSRAPPFEEEYSLVEIQENKKHYLSPIAPNVIVEYDDVPE
jgi:hypothetical protein